MSRIFKLLSVLICSAIIFSLFACQQSSKDGMPQNSVSPESSEDSSDQPKKSYKRGTCTGREYFNDWLNLRMQIPNDYEALTETMEQYNKTVKDGELFLELLLQSKYNDKHSLEITVEPGVSITVDEYIKNTIKETTEYFQSISNENDSITIKPQWNCYAFSLAGEAYTLMELQTTKYLGYGESTIHKSLGWYLLRKIDNCIINIHISIQNFSSLENATRDAWHLLEAFTSYDGNNRTGSIEFNTPVNIENQTDNNNAPAPDSNYGNFDYPQSSTDGQTNSAPDNSRQFFENFPSQDTTSSGVCANGHDWKEASCSSPKTCKVCGKLQGAPLGHDWESATCYTPATCTRCGQISGSALGHDWQAATCYTPATCSRCGKTSGQPREHQFFMATCMLCKKTDFGMLAGTYSSNNDSFTIDDSGILSLLIDGVSYSFKLVEKNNDYRWEADYICYALDGSLEPDVTARANLNAFEDRICIHVNWKCFNGEDLYLSDTKKLF